MNDEREKYQGREVEATVQAPTKEQLDKMIRGIRGYAKRQNLGKVKVLSKGKDPDGGYKAILTAHNFNPFKWAREKQRWYEARGGGPEARAKKKRDKVRADTELIELKVKRAKANVSLKEARQDLQAIGQRRPTRSITKRAPRITRKVGKLK